MNYQKAFDITRERNVKIKNDTMIDGTFVYWNNESNHYVMRFKTVDKFDNFIKFTEAIYTPTDLKPLNE